MTADKYNLPSDRPITVYLPIACLSLERKKQINERFLLPDIPTQQQYFSHCSKDGAAVKYRRKSNVGGTRQFRDLTNAHADSPYFNQPDVMSLHRALGGRGLNLIPSDASDLYSFSMGEGARSLMGSNSATVSSSLH